MTAAVAFPAVGGAGYGLAWWAPLCAGYLAVVTPSIWRDWRRMRARAVGRRHFVVGAALLVVAAALGAALVTPWRGENDVPSPGRVLVALLVLAVPGWYRSRPARGRSS